MSIATSAPRDHLYHSAVMRFNAPGGVGGTGRDMLAANLPEGAVVGTRYPILPLPHIPEQTEMIEVGPVTIGVGYRVLNDQIAAEYLRSVDYNPRPEVGEGGYGNAGAEDGGVCIHVFGNRDGELVEYFRFDCFEDEPHYHYVYPREGAQERVFLDTAMEGDAQEWALERLRSRLPQILEKVGAPEVAREIDPARLAAALPRVVEAIERATAMLTPARRAAP